MEDIEDLLGGTEDLINNPDTPVGSEEYTTPGLSEYMDLNDDPITNRVAWEGVKNIGDRGIGDSQWDKGLSYRDIEEGNINAVRAELQPWEDQLGNFLAQAVVGEIVGGTIEAMGYLLDWEGAANIISGNEKEYANWFSNIGKGIREKTQEATQIYEQNPGEINMLDSGFWFKNGVSAASTLSMMLPSMAATKGLGMLGRGLSKAVGRGARKVGKRIGKDVSKEAFDLSSKMGVKADWMAEGMSQAIFSRHIENHMEATGTFEEIYNERMMQINPDTEKYYTDEEAKQSAAGAASENYKHGWAMLAQDMVQYLSIGKVFNPVTRQMEAANKAFSKGLKVNKKIEKTARVVGTFGSEAFEEGYQNYISSRAGLRSDLQAGLITEEEYDNRLGEVISSTESKISMLFGGLGGSVFQMVGPSAKKAFKSKNRKKLEEYAAENYQNSLEAKNKLHSKLQVEKSKAESEGTEQDISMATDDIIIDMVLDGIENDNLENVMESIKNGPEMTKEEIDKFNEQDEGTQWDPEAAKAGAERALSIAKDIKEIYYKNKGKSKNKNTPSSIVKSMSRIEWQNKDFSEKFNQSKKDSKQKIEDIKYDALKKPSDRFKAKKDLEARILATEEVIKAQQAASDNSVDSDVKKSKNSIIKNHNYDLSKLRKELKKVENPDKDASEDSNVGDERAEVVHNRDMVIDIAGDYANQLAINDAMTENNMQLTRLNDKKHQKKVISDRTSALVKSINDIETLEDFKVSLEKGDVEGYSTKSDIQKMSKEVGDRISALEKEEEFKAAEEVDKRAAEEARAKAKAKNENPKTNDNNVVAVVKEALEDEHNYDEIQFEESFQEKLDESTEVSTNNGKSIALLDEVGNKAFDTWRLNGESKKGTKITYSFSPRGAFKGNISVMRGDGKKKAQLQLNAVNAFKKSIKDGSKIPQHVYDHFPLQVFVGKGSSIITFLPIKPLPSSSKADKDRHKENYSSERKNIINELAQSKEFVEFYTEFNKIDRDGTLSSDQKKSKKDNLTDKYLEGNTVSTEVQHTSGGQLKTQVDENGVVAENNIKDLQQVKRSKKEPHIVYSDVDGNLMELDKKTYNSVLGGKTLTVGEDADGNPRPYRGGLFLILNKADGTPFPVRLNFKKNTVEQAEILADLLIDVALPSDPNDNKSKKYKLSDPVGFVELDLLTRITEVMGPEMKVIKDPTIMELLNMFVYVSKQTEGMTSQLYMSGINLYFGGIGNNVNPTNVDTKKAELVEFLTNTKRRQLSLKMWNDQENYPGYRDFVLDNGIINTNVVVGESEFQGETAQDYKDFGEGRKRRRVQTWAKPLGTTVASKPAEVVKSTETKTVVQSTNDLAVSPQDRIDDSTGPTPLEINAAIKKEFPKKTYVYSNGEFKDVMGGKISSEDIAKMKTIVSNIKQPTPQTSGVEVVNEIIGPDGKTYSNINSLLEKFPDYNKEVELSASQIEEYKNTIGKIKTYSNLSPQENLKNIIKELLPNRDVGKIMLGVSTTDLMQRYSLNNQDVLIGISSFNELKNEKEYDNLSLSSIIKNIVDAIKMKDIVLSSKPTQQTSEVKVLSRNVPIAQVAAGNKSGGDINNLTEANKDLNDLNDNLVERLIDYGFGKDNILVEIPTSMVKGSTDVVLGKEEDYLVEVFEKEGQVNPIMLDKNFNIIEGRHRLFAAKKLGLPIKAYMPTQQTSEVKKFYKTSRELDTSYIRDVKKDIDLSTKENSFKDSKVDRQVFHLSKNKIDQFDSKKSGSNTGAPDTSLGLFFSEEYDTIASMGETKADLLEGKNTLGHNVHKVSINLKKPYVHNGFIDSIVDSQTKEAYAKKRKELESQGYDGIVYALAFDGVDQDYGFVVFESKNTKIESVVNDKESLEKNRPSDFGKKSIVTTKPEQQASEVDSVQEKRERELAAIRSMQQNNISKATELEGVSDMKASVKKSLTKLEYGIPNQPGSVVKLNEDGSYKESGSYFEGAYDKADGQQEVNIKKGLLTSAKKQFKEDKQLESVLESPLMDKMSNLVSKIGAKEFKNAVKANEYEKRGLYSDNIADWLSNNLDKLDSIEAIVDAELNNISKVNDTKVSKSDKKSLPSQPSEKTVTRRRSVGSGNTNRKRPESAKKKEDSSIKKEDDKKQPKCKK